MRVTTPLGGDVLAIERLAGTEGVSRPFELTLDFLSSDPSVDATKLLRKPMGVTVDLEGGGQRFFHGLTRRFVQLGRGADGVVAYRAEVVPWLWFLGASSHSRIFQNKSVPDIAKAVFADLKMTDYRVAVTGSYSPREYCVQYNETDLAFVSRLFEEEGIFYFFEHTASKHTLVLADAPSAIKAGPLAKLSVTTGEAGKFDVEHITALEVENQFFPGKVMLSDYNMETPSTNLMQQTATTVKGADNQAFELYDYPGNYGVRADGERYARIRMEEQEARNVVVSGTAYGAALVSGFKVDVADFYRRDVNKAYLVLTVESRGSNGSMRGGVGEPFAFEQAFTAIPASVQYRPERVTPRALVHGTQTAVVVGPGGEEIYVDKYGRVKVQFFWDQDGKKDDKSSCWVRVSSTWAGKQWGFIQIPRIGQEVIVDFLEGDPDRPIIVGRVYNAEQMPPYDLPANGTQSGTKSRSSANGGTDDFNELRFEDKKGSEMVTLHAQKDFTLEVENDETHWVGHDRVKNVDHDETTHVKHDRTETVDNDETITIHGTRTEVVDKDESISLGAKRTVSVKDDDTLAVSDGDQSLTLDKGKQTIAIQGDRSIVIKKGNDTLDVQTGNVSTAVSKGNHETKLDMGNVTLKASLGTITQDAMKGIELKVGQNSIKIDQSGITIKGLQVKIEGQVMTEVKGMMTTVKGDGMLTVKGGITMIN